MHNVSLKPRGLYIFIDREAREMMHLVVSVRLCVCALTAEPFDLEP